MLDKASHLPWDCQIKPFVSRRLRFNAQTKRTWMGERKTRSETMPSLRLLDLPLRTDVLIVGAGRSGLGCE